MDMKGQGAPPPYVGNPEYASSYQPQPLQSPPVITMPSVTQTTTNVTLGAGAVGGCPVCHNTSWTGTYSCCAWLLAICCFPCGIICCCCMRRKKCSNCGFTLA